jgi:hypothetical protein
MITGQGNVTVNSTTQKLQGLTTSEYSLFPNPTSGDVNLIVNGNFDLNQLFTVELISPDGKLINTIRGDLSSVNAELSGTLANTANGVYLVRVISNDAQVLRLVKE